MQSFKDFDLNPNIQKALEAIGFETPTPVQVQSLTHLLDEPQDMIALAQTGTGKTAAFSLPILHHCEPHSKKPQALILSPTRELCIQIGNDIDKFTKYSKGIDQLSVYGGTAITNQIKGLRNKPQIIVGTPGRTLDLIKRKKLDVSDVQWLVLDEADEMLSMGFQDDLNEILETTPDDKKTLLFSATLAGEIKKIADNYLSNPVEVTIGRKNISAENVDHSYYQVHYRDRYDALKRIVDMNPQVYGIVFCRTRAETKEIAAKLTEDGYNSDALHGDLSQAQRDYVMQKFRKRQLRLLVATDVAARGLDVNDLTHVINYKLPDDREVYVHRSGRTGRAGKSGSSIAILERRDLSRIRGFEKMIGKDFIKKELPSGKEICEKQLFNYIDKVVNTEVNEAEIKQFLPAIEEKLSELSQEDILKRFVSIEFNRFLDYYKGARDINDRSTVKDRRDKKGRNEDGGRDRDRRSKRGDSDVDFTRFFINLGKLHKMNPKSMLDLINNTLPQKGVEIGEIELLKGFSFFELDRKFEDAALKAFAKCTYKGLKVRIEVAQPKSKSSSGGRGGKKGGKSGRGKKRHKGGRGKRNNW